MKRIVLISVFLMVAASYAYSQTYYYRAVAVIDASGARSRPTVSGIWITFVDNKSIAFRSDESGFRSNVFHNGTVIDNYAFIRTQDGTHVYQSFIPHPLTGARVFLNNFFFYFSSDFSRMQTFHPADGWGRQYTRIEYERASGPASGGSTVPTFR